MLENNIKEYKESGCCLVKSVFTESFCDELKNHLNTLESKINIPFSDVPWGYGNLLSEGPFELITKNKFILNFCDELLKINMYLTI